MSLFVDPTQRILEQALDGLSARNALIASNLANIDTPGYQPKSLDFESTLRAEMGVPSAASGSAGSALSTAAAASEASLTGGMNPPSTGPSASVSLRQTDPRHLAGAATATDTSLGSATAFAGTLKNDGNQVDVDSEMVALVQNQLRFSAVSRLETGKLDLLRTVLGGR